MAARKPAKKELKLEKRRLEEQPDDLEVSEEEAEDIKGGFAPPYTPVLPSNRIKEQIQPPNRPGGLGQSGPIRGA
jgi:hypothetical protein